MSDAAYTSYLTDKTCTLALRRPDKARQRRIWHLHPNTVSDAA
ncbi:hypothetical protein HMPREF1589_01988 [Escherichia coli 113290]|nr:hypothetical protein HMPREF1589_01988 [Escherichia coli 113290]